MRKVASIAFGLTALVLLNSCATGASSIRMDNDRKKATEAYEKGQLNKAGEYYLKILKMNANDIEALFRLGNIYAKNSQPKKALESYEKALAVKPDFAPAWRNLAVVRLRQGLAAMIESQNHLSASDPLYISNSEIIEKLIKVPGLKDTEKNIGGKTAQTKGNLNETR